MGNRILVVYATRFGSTEQTARVVASVLGAEGSEMEVLSVKEITTWPSCSVVVLAAPLYMGKLHKDARRFLHQWRSELEKIPVALVVPGPVNPDEREWNEARTQLQKELARIPWLHPVAQQIVGGKWDPEKFGFFLRWTMRKVEAKDGRDWPAIRGWARELAGKLHPAAMAH